MKNKTDVSFGLFLVTRLAGKGNGSYILGTIPFQLVILFAWLLLTLLPANCFAQAAEDSIFIKEKDQRSLVQGEKDSLALATKLMISKKSKSVIALTGPLLEKLKREGRYTSPFGLRTRLIHGSALIHAVMNRDPFDFLWTLKDDSKNKEQWDIYAETCRVIASILEYSGRKEQSLENLREAQAVIYRHQLDSIYPHFAVRISSWHRVFGDRDSSIFYAKDAILTAQQYGKLFEEAEGNLLLAGNYLKTGPEKAIDHMRTAARLYKEVEDFSSYTGMLTNLARLALQKSNLEEAMAYIDTIIQYRPILKENNIKRLPKVYRHTTIYEPKKGVFSVLASGSRIGEKKPGY